MIVRTYEEDEITVHRVPLLLMGGLVAISLALTASVTMGFFERTSDPVVLRAEAGTQAATTRDLFFFDEADGSVRVEDAASGVEVARFGVGYGGFVRSTVRSLVHQRRIRGIGADVPFELVEWDNGNLTLRDETTGSTLELDYFGKDNRRVFAEMLEGVK
ncbi:MAG: photosynthetic complex assembly protein PuhC [Erythrobacter sp.]|uniref:photosynthetic complex assembly protein PuhC n=1 Tax=Erythrobacter sp. HL-111 TaxID=1798193 RepID=UPI0006DB834E|nr:photosynthetic complex assembly protein PuhC [Erythrobacter sp. HL-111]KPP93884.1 MAG: putative photosynthetic complex assembly protein [Erythrobacteraceae bacterium HL-111]SDS35603.1 putative photosynthetic complex assembly protein [Erythrobacter sp. HL-111]